MKTKKSLLYRFLLLSFSLLLAFVSFFSVQPISTFATERITYDESNVLDDLTGSTIGGKQFDTADYPFDKKGKTQVIYFSEFCYSFDNDKQGDYALYVYVYNPKGLAFDTESEYDSIAFAVGDNVNYNLYGLKFLNYSLKPGLEGRFYKFKVILTDSQKTEILNNINTDARVYKLSEIELSLNGAIENYPITSTYTYSGYSLGYGSDVMTESSLSCSVDGFDKYLSLEVDSTYYRPDGTNGTDDTRDTLHSVYFSVEDKIIDEFGAITAATATFYDALLAPALATGNYEAYKAIYEYLGVDIGVYNENLKYTYAGNFEEVDGGDMHFLFMDWHYNFGFWKSNIMTPSEAISPLSLLFYVNDSTVFDKAYTEAISAEAVEAKLLELTGLYGDNDVMNKYSSKLFESVASEPTLLKIDKETVNGESLDLTKQTITQTWWQAMWGAETVYTETFDNIPPLEPVDFNDLKLSDSDLSFKYKIAMADIADFKERCKDSQKSNETVYCLRYRITDYKSERASLVEKNTSIFGNLCNVIDTNAFFFQMSCDLGFQIIDLTLTKDGANTILPVLMKPMDIFHGAETPGITDSGCQSNTTLISLILFLVVLIIVFPYITPILVYAGKGIAFIITAPFKLIKKGVDKLKANKPPNDKK